MNTARTTFTETIYERKQTLPQQKHRMFSFIRQHISLKPLHVVISPISTPRLKLNPLIIRVSGTSEEGADDLQE